MFMQNNFTKWHITLDFCEIWKQLLTEKAGYILSLELVRRNNVGKWENFITVNWQQILWNILQKQNIYKS